MRSYLLNRACVCIVLTNTIWGITKTVIRLIILCIIGSLNCMRAFCVLPSIVDGLRHRSLVVREVVEVVAAAAPDIGPTRPAVDVVAAHAGPLKGNTRVINRGQVENAQ